MVYLSTSMKIAIIPTYLFVVLKKVFCTRHFLLDRFLAYYYHLSLPLPISLLFKVGPQSFLVICNMDS